jgi:hypothetical protein
MDALEAATQRWGMEISLQKTEPMELDPWRSKAAQHSRGGSIQSAPQLWLQPTALMPLLSLLLIAVLATALPLPPAACIISATGLCCCVVLVRILLALSTACQATAHRSPPPSPPPFPPPFPPPLAGSSPLPTIITNRPMPNPSCSPLPAHSPQPTAPRPISLRGHELPYMQHFRYLASYYSADWQPRQGNQLATYSSGRSRDISTHTKMRIYGSLVLSVLL